MKRIKAFFYNYQIDFVFIFCGIMSGLYLLERYQIIAEIICVFMLTYCIVFFLLNYRKSKGLKYLKFGYSLLYKNYIWINQRSIIRGNKSKCPKKEFVRELGVILEKIPEGKTCYCCTHEVIKKHILKKFPDAKVSKSYTKNLRKLKKKMKNKNCIQCKQYEDKCTLLENTITQFYMIKFVPSKNVNR